MTTANEKIADAAIAAKEAALTALTAIDALADLATRATAATSEKVQEAGALPGSVSQRTGMAIGLSATTGGMLGFGIEGLYAQRGVTSAIGVDARRVDYIDVPVYLRVAMPLPGMSPFAYAGPQASYELKCGTDTGNCPDSGRPKLTYAGVIGAGLRFGAFTGISVEARYIHGLSDLKLSTVSTSTSYQTRSFMLLAGIGF